jgi:hypothetical protein
MNKLFYINIYGFLDLRKYVWISMNTTTMLSIGIWRSVVHENMRMHVVNASTNIRVNVCRFIDETINEMNND